MRYPSRPLSNWIVDKILTYISDREGCTIEQPVNQAESVTVTFYDSFGYKYEMEIKCVGRVSNHGEGFDVLSKVSSMLVDRRNI